MFCKNCGSNVPDGQNFCPNCGTKISDNPPVAPQAPVNPAAPQAPVNPMVSQMPVPPVKQKKPKKPLSKKAIIGIACGCGAVVLAVVLTVVLMLLGVGRKSVDMEKYVHLQYDGANGYATAVVDIDNEGLNSMVPSKNIEKFNKKFYKTVTKKYGNIMGGLATMGLSGDWTDYIDITCTSDNLSNLKNGDVITYSVTIDSDLEESGYDLKKLEKGLKIKIKHKELSFTVEGLPEATVLDFNEDVAAVVKYVNEDNSALTALEGNAKALLEIPKDYSRTVADVKITYRNGNSFNIVKGDTEIGNVVCEIPNSTDFKDGQLLVNVRAVIYEKYATSYLVNGTEVKVSVPKFSKLSTNMDDFTKENFEKLLPALLQFEKNNGRTNFDVDTLKFGTKKADSDAKSPYAFCVIAYTDGRSGFFGSSPRYITAEIVPSVSEDGEIGLGHIEELYYSSDVTVFTDNMSEYITNYDLSDF